LESLVIANQKAPIHLHAFVLMSNHYHLVIDTPDANVDKFMYEFNKNFSLRLRVASGMINRMLGGRYKWTLVKDKSYYYQILKYVYLNPIKAGLVRDARQYPYSTLHLETIGKKFPIPCRPYTDVFAEKFINWVHQCHSQEQVDSIKKGLLRGEFKYTGTRQQQLPPQFDFF